MTQRFIIAIVFFFVLASCGGQSSYQDNQQVHIVRKGETLFSIAWRYGKNSKDIARWNRLGNGSLI
jgi:LysM repeat protein